MTVYFNLTSTSLPISVESLGNQWSQVSLQRMQGYPLYHWLQTETGKGEIWIENKKIILEEKEGILIAPFVPHAYYPLGDDWVTNFITFEGHLKNHFNEILSNQTYILAKDQENFAFSKHIQQMITVFEDEAQRLNLSVLCYQFLLQLGQAQEPIQEHPLFQKYIEPGIKEIQTNYHDSLTVEEIAQKLFISSQYFTRLFKKFMNQSPYQYLIDFRIRQAKELLINEPDLPVQTIATKVGFDSTSQFIHVFKKRTQSTPKKFRSLY